MVKIETGIDSIFSIKDSLSENEKEEIRNFSEIIDFIERRYEDASGQELTIIPYTSLEGSLSSKTGRKGLTSNEINNVINHLSSYGKSFNLAINNCFYYNDVSLDPVEEKFLDIMDQQNRHEDFQHEVTIASSRMFGMIKDRYKDLVTVSSLKSTFADNQNYMDIEERFRNYDYVVMHNFHKNGKVMKKYEDNAEKMVFFINYPCNSNPLVCADHFIDIELGDYHYVPMSNKDEINDVYFDGSCSFQHNNFPRNNDNLVRNSKAGFLYDSGVRNFKLSRTFNVTIDAIDSLAQMTSKVAENKKIYK